MISQLAPTKKNIAAIIVSHDPGKEFLSNIRSTSAQVDKVVVVNNDSKKLTSGFFKKEKLDEKVHLISNRDNLGQGKALNQGVKLALSKGYEWVLLLDQDSLPNSSMVKEQIKVYQTFLHREKIGVIGSNCTYRNLREIKYQKECQGKLYFERDVVMMSGSLLALSAWKEIGPFREEFFLDSTDADYCLRLRTKGHHIIVACRAQMMHSVGEAGSFKNFFGKKILVTNHNHIRCYYMERNGLILVKEYLFREPYWALRRVVWYFLIKPGLVVLYEKDKLRKLKYMMQGTLHALVSKTGKYE